MSWIGVITDVGRDLLAQYVSGGVSINVNRITVGSGLVSAESMREATNLTYFRDFGTIIKKEDVARGVDFEFQIGPSPSTSYEAHEIGLWANVDGEDGVMLALFQNTAGELIPAKSTNPDYAYILSAALVIDDFDTLTITVDGTAYVNYVTYNARCAQVDAWLDGKVDKETGKGLSHEDFTLAEKEKLAGIEAQANKYTLPKASANTLGGVKIGTGISIDGNGVISNSAVRSVATGTADGTLAVNTDGTTANVAVKGLKSAAYREAGSFANASHNHSAADINSGTLPVARGGTGITTNPSELVNLGSETAANVFQTSPRPGVTGTLPVAHGGTGITSNPSIQVNLESTGTDSVFKASPRPGVSGVLPLARGGTGQTNNPSMLTNLGTTNADTVFKASPRPGVTGTLPIANGGTGSTTASGARSNLGAAAASHTHNASDINAGTLPVARGGTGADTAAGARTNLGAAAASHVHSASDITSGTLAVARGGTGIGSTPSVLIDLGSGNAASIYASAPRPGVTGTLPVAHGGTGITSNPSMLTNLGSTSADNVMKATPRPGVTGTLPIANGGTGITSNPSMLTNLGSTSADTVMKATPRPGVTGVLPVANGGTGANSAAGARTNLGAAAASHTHVLSDISNLTGAPNAIGFFTGNGAVKRKIDIGFTPSKVVLMAVLVGQQYNKYASNFSGPTTPGPLLVMFKTGQNYVHSGCPAEWVTADAETYMNREHGGAVVVSGGFMVGYYSESTNQNNNMQFINTSGYEYMYLAWR